MTCDEDKTCNFVSINSEIRHLRSIMKNNHDIVNKKLSEISAKSDTIPILQTKFEDYQDKMQLVIDHIVTEIKNNKDNINKNESWLRKWIYGFLFLLLGIVIKVAFYV